MKKISKSFFFSIEFQFVFDFRKYKKITGGFRKAISKTKYIQEKEKKQTNKTEIIDNDNEELKFDSKNESIRQRKEPESLFKTK